MYVFWYRLSIYINWKVIHFWLYSTYWLFLCDKHLPKQHSFYILTKHEPHSYYSMVRVRLIIREARFWTHRCQSRGFTRRHFCQLRLWPIHKCLRLTCFPGGRSSVHEKNRLSISQSEISNVGSNSNYTLPIRDGKTLQEKNKTKTNK